METYRSWPASLAETAFQGVEKRASGVEHSQSVRVLGTWPNAHVASVGIGILQSCLGISQLVTLPGNFVLFFSCFLYLAHVVSRLTVAHCRMWFLAFLVSNVLGFKLSGFLGFEVSSSKIPYYTTSIHFSGRYRSRIEDFQKMLRRSFIIFGARFSTILKRMI